VENLKEFKEFYLKSIVANLKSYYVHFNAENFDFAIEELIDTFYQTHQINPFEISEPKEIVNKLKEAKEPFASYSKSKGTNIPNAILNTHYVNFLKFYNKKTFSNLQDFINQLHYLFGGFTETFQKERIKFNGNDRVASKTEIFGNVRDDYWTINKGSEKELQYHIFKKEDILGYGLGFNAQKSRTNLDPINEVSPFIKAFVKNYSDISVKFKDYYLINSSLDDLSNIKEGDFILYGKELPIVPQSDNSFEIEKGVFLNVYYDLKYRQFNIYKEIYSNSKNLMSPLDTINSIIKNAKMKSLLEYKKQIILQGPPGTGKTREAKLIAKEILGLNSTDDLKDNEQFKLIQFHPSYTYEDFVRGIVAESKGDKIEYKNVNKTLGEFAEVALKNYTTSKETGIDNNLDSWIDTQFELFKEDIKAQLPENEIPLSGDITIYDVADNSFKYGKNWKTASHILFGEFKSLVRAVIKNELELSNKQMDKEKFRHAHYRYTYYNALLEKFFQEYKYESSGELIKEKKYILVIDEINRANLSSVLGELIYALEYRNESVHSPYGIKDENNKVKTELILPPNLYIIGTMNTADRSVGHIDYAIRRRFAFVDVLPEKLEDNSEIYFNTTDFMDVAKLFIKIGEDDVVDFEKAENSDFLSDDFSAKDVALGHSYFIAEKKKISEDKKQEYFNMKMKYEVIPILNEYLKDGVFNEKATVKIKEIEQRFA
jgi:hypothetical protein